jgi:hypothetical protein
VIDLVLEGFGSLCHWDPNSTNFPVKVRDETYLFELGVCPELVRVCKWVLEGLRTFSTVQITSINSNNKIT